MDLSGEDDGAVVGDGQAVGGTALGAGGGSGAGVDGDQSEGLEFGGDGARGGAGDTEFGGEDGAGGGAAGVDELEGGAERVAAAFQPCTRAGHVPILTLCLR